MAPAGNWMEEENYFRYYIQSWNGNWDCQLLLAEMGSADSKVLGA